MIKLKSLWANNRVLSRKINILSFTSWLQCKDRKPSQITACCTFKLDQIQCKKYTIFSLLVHFACWANFGNDGKQCRQWPICHIQISVISFPIATLCLIYLLNPEEKSVLQSGWLLLYLKCNSYIVKKKKTKPLTLTQKNSQHVWNVCPLNVITEQSQLEAVTFWVREMQLQLSSGEQRALDYNEC